jgi:hypothetical protein
MSLYRFLAFLEVLLFHESPRCRRAPSNAMRRTNLLWDFFRQRLQKIIFVGSLLAWCHRSELVATFRLLWQFLRFFSANGRLEPKYLMEIHQEVKIEMKNDEDKTGLITSRWERGC